ncbi:type IV pilus assembly protein PilM [uncultured Eubacterium sp.]|nr:type IV pilus assembly protein PilM [uncultured Eubacterium sp.]
MAKKKILGIEIGNCRLKIAVCSDYNLERLITADLPDNLVQEDEIVSWDAMAEFIKEVIKENKISVKSTAVVIPEKLVYTKHVVMPAMTVDQLKVNLPYEFHDYITEEKDKYFYDYAVMNKTFDDDGNLTEMELMAVAILKETVNQYKTMFRRAGLRLNLVAPDYCAIRNIIKDYEEVNDLKEPGDYAVLDIGHKTVKLYFFTKGEYEITRVMEAGCEEIDRHIAENLNVEEHIARIYKETNKDDILHEPGCEEIYSQMAIEVMRVLNFYNFNHPDNGLDALYYCGGGSLITPLIDAIAGATEVKVVSLDNLLTDKYEDTTKILQGPQALGITWE